MAGVPSEGPFVLFLSVCAENGSIARGPRQGMQAFFIKQGRERERIVFVRYDHKRYDDGFVRFFMSVFAAL